MKYTPNRLNKIKQYIALLRNETYFIQLHPSRDGQLLDTYFSFKCKEMGHLNKISYYQLKKNKSLCVACAGYGNNVQKYYEEVIKPILKQNNLTHLEEYQNLNTPTLLRCNICKNTYKTQLQHLKYTNKSCSICSGRMMSHSILSQTLEGMAFSILPDSVKDEYTNTDKINIYCQKCNHKLIIKPMQLKRKVKLICPQCASLNPDELMAVNTGIIYRATFPSGKVYIGQTIQSLVARINKHKRDATSPSAPGYYTTIADAIRKYGFNNIEWKVLHKDVPYTKLDELEINEIANHDSYHNGYNETIGGKANYANANSAVDRFNKHLRKQKEKEIKARASAQKRSLTNFEKNMGSELKQFLKKDMSNAEQERDEFISRLNRSKAAQEKKRNLDSGIDKKSSQYRGVCWDKKLGKWKANIKHNGKKIHIGMFVCEKDAAIAYDEMAKKLKGADAKLNFI